MKKTLPIENIFLFVIFCMPLYLIKVTILSMPTNIFELLAIFLIMIAVFQQKKLSAIDETSKLPTILTLSSILILIGVFVSTILNDSYLGGFGILKSWFILPMFFSYLLFIQIKSKILLERIYLSLYVSTFFVGLLAIIYKILNITTYDNRLSAFYSSPNYLAMYLASGIFFGIYLFLKSYSINKKSKQTFFYFLSLLITLSSLYYTYSYGAWIAFLASMFLTLTIIKTNKKIILIGGTTLIVSALILFALQINTEKFLSIQDLSSRSSLASRQTIWQVSKVLIEKNAFFGIGPGNFQKSYLEMQHNFPPYLEWAVPQPHNIFIAFWLQAGLLGLIGFLLLLFVIISTFWSIFKDKKKTALAAPLLGFFIYTILHGLIDTTYWKNDLSFLFWLCVFLLLNLHNYKKEITS